MRSFTEWREQADLQVVTVPTDVGLPTPAALRQQWPLETSPLQALVQQTRIAIRRILHQSSQRRLVVCSPGPMSDRHRLLTCAHLLRAVRTHCNASTEIILQVELDALVRTGPTPALHSLRPFLLELLGAGMPLGATFRDTLTHRYVDDLLSWAQVSDCSIESQVHREMASGVPMPIAFGINSDGTSRIALDAIRTASTPHHFIAIDNHGRVGVVATRGNPDGHLLAHCRLSELRVQLDASPGPCALRVGALGGPEEPAWARLAETLCLWHDTSAEAQASADTEHGGRQQPAPTLL